MKQLLTDVSGYVSKPDLTGARKSKSGRMLEFGTTRVELGVQTLDDDIYRLVRRGHTVADVIKATKLLKESGIKVYYHWMPGLPGSTLEHDVELSRHLFQEEAFQT